MIRGAVLGLLIALSWAGYQADQKQQRVAYQAVARAAAPKDSALAVRAVVTFLNWYKNRIDSVSRIALVDQKPGKVYSVNFKNGEKYLACLRSSRLLTDAYLNEWRVYFRERQQGFQLSRQREGTPTGFEYDLVLLSQEAKSELAELKTVKIDQVTLQEDRARVELDLRDSYEFRLVRKNGVWLINEILNLSAE
ncbi:hypothetical protein GCM10027299_30210 [Larkinella ripae]